MSSLYVLDINLLLNISFANNFLIFYLFIFRERGREGEREGEKHQCVVASHEPPTRYLACTPGMCPDWQLNWWPFGSQAHAQSTELHQLGLFFVSLMFCNDIFRFLSYVLLHIFCMFFFVVSMGVIKHLITIYFELIRTSNLYYFISFPILLYVFDIKNYILYCVLINIIL